MNEIIKDIDDILRTKYNSTHALFFLGRGPDNGIKIDEFKREIGLEVPNILEEYYEWMMRVDFGITKEEHNKYFGSTNGIKYPYNQNYDSYFDCDNQTESLSGIINNTNIWRKIQEEQPNREWKRGFLEICDWNSAYVMVIDTKGEVSNKGSILYWDYKGGDVYRIRYDNFEKYLITKLELLKKNLYFPLVFGDENSNDDFYYGKTRKAIEATIESLNTTFCIDFNASLPFIPQLPQIINLNNLNNLINQRVKIVAGPFKTLTGTITSIDGNKLNVAVEIFGSITQVMLGDKDVELL